MAHASPFKIMKTTVQILMKLGDNSYPVLGGHNFKLLMKTLTPGAIILDWLKSVLCFAKT